MNQLPEFVKERRKKLSLTHNVSSQQQIETPYNRLKAALFEPFFKYKICFALKNLEALERF